MAKKLKKDSEDQDMIDFDFNENNGKQSSDENIGSDNYESNDDQMDNDLNDQKTGEDINDETKDEKKEVLFPEISLLSKIKNKLRKRELYIKLKKEKKEVLNRF